ncbi:MAG: hypothetical protein R2991_13785 [Thermoanaerobaculia bacterium]
MRRTLRGSAALIPVLALGLAFTGARSAHAEQVVTTVDWQDRSAAAGDVVEVDGHAALRVEGAARPLVLEVLRLEEPGVSGPRFALRGEVRHRDVAGAAYLEMWTELPNGERYFTRTLAESGPMGNMRGSSSGWRPIELPFDLGESGERPERLVLNVVLPGPGVVELGELELVDEIP